MRREFIAIITLYLMLTSTTVVSEDLIFQNTTFKISISDGENLASSSVLQIRIIDGPTFPVGAFYELEYYSDPSTHFVFDESTEIIMTDNIISKTQGYNLSVNFNGVERELLSYEVPKAVWNHMTHIYANWTFGTPTPDGRGFGQGVITDLELLDDLINTTITEIQAPIVGEAILNILLGKSIDFNNDSTSMSISDGYGFFNYTYGMRDHIRNANLASGATNDQKINGSANVVNIEKVVLPDSFTFVSDINGSGTLGGNLYKNAFILIENSSAFVEIVSTINTIFEELKMIMEDAFYGFRSIVMDVQTVSSFSLSDNLTTTSQTEESGLWFDAIILSIVIIPVLIRKRSIS